MADETNPAAQPAEDTKTSEATAAPKSSTADDDKKADVEKKGDADKPTASAEDETKSAPAATDSADKKGDEADKDQEKPAEADAKKDEADGEKPAAAKDEGKSTIAGRAHHVARTHDSASIPASNAYNPTLVSMASIRACDKPLLNGCGASVLSPSRRSGSHDAFRYNMMRKHKSAARCNATPLPTPQPILHVAQSQRNRAGLAVNCAVLPIILYAALGKLPIIHNHSPTISHRIVK